MDKTKVKRKKQIRRHKRVRKTVSGTVERPRLTVFRSLQHIYAQIIDDSTSRTLVAASTARKEVQEGMKSCGNIKAAEAIGTRIAEKALANGIRTVVFDRGAYKYHGRVKALAEAARKTGLVF